jgi:methionyl-tRNA formyltransferase
VKALDAGPMLAAVHRPIGPMETSDEVERGLAQIGAALLVSTVDALADDAVTQVLQDDAAATYAHRLAKADGAIDWSQPAVRVHNLVRGLHPWPHAFTHRGDQRVILLRSEPLPDSVDAPPGTIVHAAGDDLRVATGDGILRIVEMQAEGKRPMTPRDFLAGHQLRPGERFAS